MKKAFDQNVSRAKPRVRLGSATALTEVEPAARAPVAPPDLAAEVKARAAAVAEPKPSAVQAVQLAIGAPRASAMPPPEVVEIQTPPVPGEVTEQLDLEERRERLKERLRSVRENPRPEPLPATVAQAGQLAVERISGL